jgi:hypothetical protein
MRGRSHVCQFYLWSYTWVSMVHFVYRVCKASVLSFICDHFEVLIATGAQARGLLVEVFVEMVSVAWLCICLNRLCS